MYWGTVIIRWPLEATSSLVAGVATDDGASRFTDSANRVLQFEAVSVTITLPKPQGRAVER